MEEPRVTKPKRTMTEKQKCARLANLKAGREKRMERIKQKKETNQQEYDLSSGDESESSSESDDDAFVISKKKKRQPKPIVQGIIPTKPSKVPKLKDESLTHLNNKFDQLTNIVMAMATKQNKTKRKQTKRPSGGTKIVVLPQPNTNPSSTKTPSELAYLETLRKSFFG